MLSKPPIRVAVTGAAGHIAYALLFRIASGEMLGPDQPVILQLLEIPPAMPALDGVRMELEDCAYPLLMGIITTDKPEHAFRDADYALLLGSRPRTKGMERADLLEANGHIFSEQGRALNEVASRRVRVLVVGNPANTNALIAMGNAPDLDPGLFTAMTRLDHNRSIVRLADQANVANQDIKKVAIWGNHSNTMYPDTTHTLIGGRPAHEVVGTRWCRETFIPLIRGRGAAILEARGMSSAASAAFAALDAVKNWCCGTPEDDWVSMGIPSDGSYEVPEGLIFSYPVQVKAGRYEIVQNLDFDDFGRRMMEGTIQELESERDAVRHLLLG